MFGTNKRVARIAHRVGFILGLLAFVATPQIGKVAHAEVPGAAPWIGYTKINVTDLPRSIDFYTKVMGLKISATTDFPSSSETLLTRSGAYNEDTILLTYVKKRTEPLVHGNAFNNLTFIIDNFDEVVGRMEAAGYVVTGKRTALKSPVPYAKTLSMAFTKDPDGYVIEIIQFFN